MAPKKGQENESSKNCDISSVVFCDDSSSRKFASVSSEGCAVLLVSVTANDLCRGPALKATLETLLYSGIGSGHVLMVVADDLHKILVSEAQAQTLGDKYIEAVAPFVYEALGVDEAKRVEMGRKGYSPDRLLRDINNRAQALKGREIVIDGRTSHPSFSIVRMATFWNRVSSQTPDLAEQKQQNEARLRASVDYANSIKAEALEYCRTNGLVAAGEVAQEELQRSTEYLFNEASLLATVLLGANRLSSKEPKGQYTHLTYPGKHLAIVDQAIRMLAELSGNVGAASASPVDRPILVTRAVMVRHRTPPLNAVEIVHRSSQDASSLQAKAVEAGQDILNLLPNRQSRAFALAALGASTCDLQTGSGGNIEHPAAVRLPPPSEPKHSSSPIVAQGYSSPAPSPSPSPVPEKSIVERGTPSKQTVSHSYLMLLLANPIFLSLSMVAVMLVFVLYKLSQLVQSSSPMNDGPHLPSRLSH